MQKQTYNTKARKYILDFLSIKSDTTVSVADIIEYLKKQAISVNPTTVYRYLNKLSKEQKVIKISAENGQHAAYQLNSEQKSCSEHIHTQCIRCGKLIHLDCHFMNDLKSHLYDDHKFTLKCEGSILYGICEDCGK